MMKRIALMLHNLISLDSYLLDIEGNITFSTSESVLNDDLENDRKESLKEISLLMNDIEPQGCLFYESISFQNYLSGFSGDRILVMGPFLTTIPEPSDLAEIKTLRQGLELSSYYRRQNILESRQIKASADLMISLLSEETLEASLTRKKAAGYISKENNGEKPGTIESETDISIVTERYRIENDLMEAISRGDREELNKVMAQTGETMAIKDRVKGNPLRSAKDLTITLNTIMRVAARQGGLHPRYLHSISEKNAILIEKQRTLHDLMKLQTDMTYEYCDAVKYRGTINYSHLVKKGIRYITENLDDDLSLQTVADRIDVNSTYLSKLFKRETGKTFTRYVNEMRVDEASYLMKKTDNAIAEIAMQVGYGDSAYFSRIFKKIKGKTPAAWRSEKSD